MQEFNETGYLPSGIEHVWDTNHLLDEESITAKLLKALFSYNGNPSLTVIIAYISYSVLIWLGV